VDPNHQSIASDHAADNHQPILSSQHGDNDAKAASLAKQKNDQAIDQAGVNANQQPVEGAAASLNLQAAPEDVTGDNRQPTEKDNLSDHYEVLPSEKIERATVDFGSSVIQTTSSTSPTPAKAQAVKAVRRDTAPPSAKQAALTKAQIAKAQHDKFVEAFHGRLAGIKHDVDAVNQKLDDFEKKKP
jgi:hypothetical protein